MSRKDSSIGWIYTLQAKGPDLIPAPHDILRTEPGVVSKYHQLCDQNKTTNIGQNIILLTGQRDSTV